MIIVKLVIHLRAESNYDMVTISIYISLWSKLFFNILVSHLLA